MINGSRNKRAPIVVTNSLCILFCGAEVLESIARKGALVAMEVSVNSDNKSKGVGCQDGKSGGKMHNVTMGMEVFDCSICSNPLRSPIFQVLSKLVHFIFFIVHNTSYQIYIFFLYDTFQCSKGNSICSPCCNKLPESDRSAA
jgi:E3 ubiquitin-protein ligase SIAH1